MHANIKKSLTVAGILGALALCGQTAGCNSTAVAIAQDACAGAAAMQASQLRLNGPQAKALAGMTQDCAILANGSSVNAATVTAAIISSAVILQSSGYLPNVHITALAPDEAKWAGRHMTQAQIENVIRRYVH